MAAMLMITIAMAATGMQPTAAASPQATAARSSADQRVVCRREESTVGTRLASRTCLTRAEWRQRDVQNRESARSLIEDSERDGRQGYDGAREGGKFITPD